MFEEQSIGEVAQPKPVKAQQFDELTFMRSIVGKLRRLDYDTTVRVLNYVVNWNETRKPTV